MLTRPGSRCMLLLVALLVVSGLCSAQQQPTGSAPPSPAAPAVAPEALAALEKMGGFLRTLKTYTLRADSTIDEVLDDTGQKVQFGGTVDFHVRAPDRLRVEVASDRKQRQAFYDGTTLTLYGPRTKYYASVPAPPTIRAMLEVAEQKYGLEFPLSDLFYWGTDKAHPEDIKTALYVGPSVIGGMLCDHYVFRQEDLHRPGARGARTVHESRVREVGIHRGSARGPKAPAGTAANGIATEAGGSGFGGCRFDDPEKSGCDQTGQSPVIEPAH